MKKEILIFLAAVLACVSPAAAEVSEKRSEEGYFLMKVQTEPSRPRVGNNNVTLTIVDGRSMSPVEGATIEVIPWMTMHGHGSSKKTRIREKGKGTYVVEDVYFTMTGDWDLLIRVQKDKVEDKAVVTLKNVRN